MKNKKFNQRLGTKALIVRLDFHDWTGNLISRTRCKTAEKEIVMRMISQIMNRCDIGIEDYRKAAENELIREANEQRFAGKHNIKWTRDEKENIVSPFSSRHRKV